MLITISFVSLTTFLIIKPARYFSKSKTQFNFVLTALASQEDVQLFWYLDFRNDTNFSLCCGAPCWSVLSVFPSYVIYSGGKKPLRPGSHSQLLITVIQQSNTMWNKTLININMNQYNVKIKQQSIQCQIKWKNSTIQQFSQTVPFLNY
jgi:hypothetical protein